MAGGYYGYTGWAKIDGTGVLLVPGASLDRPRNISAPSPNNNQYGPTNYAEGARFPAVQLPCVCHVDWFTAASLNAWFVTRATAVNDLAALGAGLQFAESAIGQYRMLSGVKGAGFTLSARFGQNPLVMNMSFQGLALDATVVAPVAFPPTTAPMTFSAITLGGAFANVGIIGITIQYNTGLTPNEELNATNAPSEHNADHPTGTVTIQQYAKAAVLPPGYTDADNYTEVTTATVTFAAAAPVVFSFPRLVLQNPNQRQMQAGRVIRSFTYTMFGTVAAYPLAIA